MRTLPSGYILRVWRLRVHPLCCWDVCTPARLTLLHTLPCGYIWLTGGCKECYQLCCLSCWYLQRAAGPDPPGLCDLPPRHCIPYPRSQQ